MPENIKTLLGENKLFAIELLDEILDKTFGMRLYEARVETYEKKVVKPRIEKKVMTPSGMSNYSGLPKSSAKKATMDGVSRQSVASLHS